MHPLLVRLSVLSLVVALTSYNINRIVPEPYLDEVFHIPQAQAYCRNAFSAWDPKLTTPAGLYLLSYPLSYLGACTPTTLRAVNGLGVAVLLPVIIYRIQQTLHGKGPGRNEASAQIALNVALFPLLYFFGGLYYTDVWSTTFVLAAYLATLRDRPWVAAAYGWVALWFRQTNVVWVLFMAGVAAVRKLEEAQHEESEDSTVTGQELIPTKFLDPRQWGSIKIHNPPLSSSTTLTGILPYPSSLM
jgi:alpha-1,2-glucosyltransferase